MRDITISCSRNGVDLNINSPITVVYSFEWLFEHFTQIVFIGSLAARIFVQKCDETILSMKCHKKDAVIVFKCSMSTLCPFKIEIVEDGLNCGSTHGKFLVKTVCLHDHREETIPNRRLSDIEKGIYKAKAYIKKQETALQYINEKIGIIKNKSSKKKYLKEKANIEKRLEKKKKELEILLEMPPVADEFEYRFGFRGASDDNEKRYIASLEKLPRCVLDAIKEYWNGIDVHKNVVNAAREYNSERDEIACNIIPSVNITENAIITNVSLNVPLSKRSREMLVSKVLEGCNDIIIDEDDHVNPNVTDQETRGSKRRRVNDIQLDGSGGEDESEEYNNCSESESYTDLGNILSDDFQMSDVASEIDTVLRSNPIDIEKLDKDFDKSIKMVSIPLRNCLHNLFFVKYDCEKRKYSAISRDKHRKLKENSTKVCTNTNEYYQSFDGFISKDTFRKDISEERKENLKKSMTIHYIKLLSICIYL